MLTTHLYPKIILVILRISSRTGYLLVQRTQRRGRKRGQMQIATYPNAALHPCGFVFQLKWLEADHESGYEIPRVGRKDWHGYHFMDISTGLDITDLLCVRQSVEGKLSFGLCIELSNVGSIGRLDHCACAIKKAIKSGVQRSGC